MSPRPSHELYKKPLRATLKVHIASALVTCSPKLSVVSTLKIFICCTSAQPPFHLNTVIVRTFQPIKTKFCIFWHKLLLQVYEELVKTFYIKDKIIRLVTDSAFNDISSFRNLIILGFEQYFIDDDDNEIVEEDGDIKCSDGTLSEEHDEPEYISLLATSNSTPGELTAKDLIENSFRNLLENNTSAHLTLLTQFD
ncbi:unnamed protein product [Adineta ricciae]|uniref:Uncharacterized protein n=1 Tax=Adineta ricciae TaxID=249248 RepID=A0A815UZ25_ADIRI|nr:unnamed protein product [Adineta ricciae]CAF1522546.1 unnamed protein product [Adineta ricciae]